MIILVKCKCCKGIKWECALIGDLYSLMCEKSETKKKEQKTTTKLSDCG